MHAVFDSDSIHRILHVRRIDCVPTAELRQKKLVQKRLVMLQDGELTKNLLLPTPPRTRRRRSGGQLKTWATTIKADFEPLRIASLWLRTKEEGLGKGR